jgi:hypothetical protein
VTVDQVNRLLMNPKSLDRLLGLAPVTPRDGRSSMAPYFSSYFHGC